MTNCGVSAAFSSVGMDVYAFHNTRAAAVPPSEVKSFEDLSSCLLQGVIQTLRGKSPPGL
jgi:hypothetical protein